MIRRNCSLIMLALLLTLSVSALDVDTVEVESTQAFTIEFINYVGPHTIIESAEAIRGIGRNLGNAVAKGSKRFGEIGRYSVIHAVDASTPIGFDADILFLGEGAKVDHIDNLRRIIAGYLEGAYAYSKKDADTLAVFISIYNAVYRGKMDYFNSKYKAVVTKELSQNTAGLALRWDEWAGRSRIVIPLSARAGTGILGSIDTSPITDKSTVESLKQESADKGIDKRMDIVDLKERSQEEEKAAIDAEKARITKEEKALAEEKAKTEPIKTELSQAQELPESKSREQAKTETDKAIESTEKPEDKKSEIGSEQSASIAVSDKAKEEEKAIADKEAKLAEDKAKLEEREKVLEAKDQEIAADRADIAKDQKEAIKSEITAANAKIASGTVLFELVDPNQPFSRLSLIDLKTGENLQKSQVNTLKANTVQDVGGAYVAVAGQANSSAAAVRLARIDKTNYDNVLYSKEDVFPDSPLWKYGDSLYVVIKNGTNWVIGRYDSIKLELKASSAPVSRFSFLSQSPSGLVAQSPGGTFLILDAEKLTTITELKR